MVPKKSFKHHVAITAVLLTWLTTNLIAWEGIPLDYWGRISVSISLFFVSIFFAIGIYVLAVLKNSTTLKINTAILWILQIPAYWFAIKFYGPACGMNYFVLAGFLLTVIFPIICIPLLIDSHERGANA